VSRTHSASSVRTIQSQIQSVDAMSRMSQTSPAGRRAGDSQWSSRPGDALAAHPSVMFTDRRYNRLVRPFASPFFLNLKTGE